MAFDGPPTDMLERRRRCAARKAILLQESRWNSFMSRHAADMAQTTERARKLAEDIKQSTKALRKHVNRNGK